MKQAKLHDQDQHHKLEKDTPTKSTLENHSHNKSQCWKTRQYQKVKTNASKDQKESSNSQIMNTEREKETQTKPRLQKQSQNKNQFSKLNRCKKKEEKKPKNESQNDGKPTKREIPRSKPKIYHLEGKRKKQKKTNSQIGDQPIHFCGAQHKDDPHTWNPNKKKPSPKC